MSGFMQGRRILVTGVASNLSIATGSAKAMYAQGAELAFTYQNERLQGRVEKVAAECGGAPCFPCDVGEDEQIDALFASLKQHWPDGFDGLVHAIAFAPAEELTGNFADVTTRQGFMLAQDVSAYSLVALAKAAAPQLREGASVVTLTYEGSRRALANYNVMGVAKASLEASVRYLSMALGTKGIRVNAVSAGPIRTLAASGIKSFKTLLEIASKRSALQRNVTIEEVGNVVAFVCSDLASGMSGDCIYVDAGMHTIGVNPVEIED